MDGRVLSPNNAQLFSWNDVAFWKDKVFRIRIVGIMRLGIYPPILRIKSESIIIFSSSNRETYQLIREKVICVKICQRFLAVWSTNTQSRRKLVFFCNSANQYCHKYVRPSLFWRTNDKQWLSTYGRIAWLAWLKRPVTASATESTSYSGVIGWLGKRQTFGYIE